jgi:hypothetical protein
VALAAKLNLNHRLYRLGFKGISTGACNLRVDVLRVDIFLHELEMLTFLLSPEAGSNLTTPSVKAKIV